MSLKLQESIELHENELQGKKDALLSLFNTFNGSVKKKVNLGNMRAKHQLKKLENKFDKIAEKPFKKDKKQIKKIKKSYQSIEKKFDKTIRKKVAPLRKADSIIGENLSFLQGAKGEELVIKKLSELPNTYYVFNEYKFKLGKSVYSKRTHDYVRSARIDHLVIGPTGIFLIETKNWSAERLRTANFSPHR